MDTPWAWVIASCLMGAAAVAFVIHDAVSRRRSRRRVEASLVRAGDQEAKRLSDSLRAAKQHALTADAEVNRLKGELAGCGQQRDEGLERERILQDRIDPLKGSVAAMAGEVAHERRQSLRLSVEADKVRQENVRLAGQLSAVRAELFAGKQSHDLANDRNRELVEQRAALVEERNRANEEIARLVMGGSAAEEEIVRLTRDVEGLVAKVTGLENEVTWLQQEVACVDDLIGVAMRKSQSVMGSLRGEEEADGREG